VGGLADGGFGGGGFGGGGSDAGGMGGSGGSGGPVFPCPPGNCGVEHVVDGLSWEMMTDATNVYWKVGESISTAPKSGGGVGTTAVTLPDKSTGKLTGDDDSLYLYSKGSSTTTLQRYPKNGDPPTFIHEDSNCSSCRVVVESDVIYFSAGFAAHTFGWDKTGQVKTELFEEGYDLRGNSSKLYWQYSSDFKMASKTVGATPEVFGSSIESSTTPFEVDETGLFYGHDDRVEIHGISLSPPYADTQLNTNVIVAGFVSPPLIDPNHAYVLASVGADAFIYRVPLASGLAEVFVEVQSGARALTQDETHIYWATPGGCGAGCPGQILRKAK